MEKNSAMDGSDRGSEKRHIPDLVSEREVISAREQNEKFSQIQEKLDKNFTSMTDYISPCEPKGSSFQLTDGELTVASNKKTKTISNLNAENMGSYSEGLKAVTPEEQAKYTIEYINKKAHELGYDEIKVTTFGQLETAELKLIDPKTEIQKVDEERTPTDWLEAAQKISKLPFDQQLQVLGIGLGSGINEYNRQQRERSIGALIGTVQGVGTIAVNLAKVADFSAYLIINDRQRAGQMVDEFGEALGTSITGGFRLFEGAHRYLNDVGKAGYQGDYTKVFRDIDNLGKHMDKAWSELPPREQSRIISKLGTELAADGLVGLGVAKASGKLPGQFTKILDTISSEAQQLHQAGKNISQKSVNAIKGAVDDLLQPEFVTPDGQKIKLGHLENMSDDTKITSLQMSQADNVDDSGKLVNKGMNAAGKALKFSEESGIELGELRLGQDKVWEQASFPRGDDVHVVLGENLPAGTKTIDRVVFRDGVVEGQKSIDLTADSYADPKKLESKLKGYVWGMKLYEGQERHRMCFQMSEDKIAEKVLHIGIKNGSMTEAQKATFEKIGKEIQDYNKNLPFYKAPLKLKVTVVK